MLHIGFMCFHDPSDKRSFSGTPHYMLSALKNANCKVDVLGDNAHTVRRRLHKFWRFTAKLLGEERIHRWQFWQYLRSARRDIQKHKPDIIFGLAASKLFAKLNLEDSPPSVLITDATLGFILETYGHSYPLPTKAEEQKALHLSSAVIFSSSYMIKRAEQEYCFSESSPTKLNHLAFGLNMPQQAFDDEELPAEPIKLGFIGLDWQRKGGEIAVKALETLTSRGWNAELYVIGNHPEELGSNNPRIHGLGPLDKNKPEQSQRIQSMLKSLHLLLVPSQADCTPMVVAEANSWGVPVIANEVGGMASIVKDGKNGFLMPINADASQYADTIGHTLRDPIAYAMMRRSARDWQQAVLNWEVWAQSAIDIASRAIKGRQVH
jgi:glycosyltransferase involved in cell wall biosynthesis